MDNDLQTNCWGKPTSSQGFSGLLTPRRREFEKPWAGDEVYKKMPLVPYRVSVLPASATWLKITDHKYKLRNERYNNVHLLSVTEFKTILESSER